MSKRFYPFIIMILVIFKISSCGKRKNGSVNVNDVSESSGNFNNSGSTSTNQDSTSAITELNNLISWNLFESGAFSNSLVKDYVTSERRSIQPGKCYLFDGTDDYIDMSSIGSLSTAFTYSIWVKGDGFILGRMNGADYLRIEPSGRIQFRANSGAVFTPTGDASITDWVHIAVTRNSSGNTKIYYNGVEKTMWNGSIYTTGGLSLPGNSDLDYIGKESSDYYGGKVREFIVYDSELTSSEVLDLYEDRIKDGAILHFKSDESAGSISYDSSGNNNHGSITNADLSTFHNVDTGIKKSYQNDVGYKNHTLFYDTNEDITLIDGSPFTGITNATIEFKVVISDDTIGVCVSNDAIGGFAIGTYEDNGVSDSFTNVGSPAVYVDNVLIGDTRDDLYTALSDGEEHLVKYVGLDLTSMSGLGLNTFKGSFILDNIILSNVKLDLTSDGSYDHHWQGFGISDWDDTIGNWDAISVNALDILIPRDESNTSVDILGNTLQYSSRVKYDFNLVNSNALTFDGVDDYVQLSDALGSPASYSVSFKFKTNTSSANIIFSANDGGSDGFSALVRATGEVGIKHNSSNHSTSGTYNDNTWYQFEASWDGSNIVMTVLDTDGNEIEEVTVAESSSLNITTSSRLGEYSASTPIYPYLGSLVNFKLTIDGDTHYQYPLAEGSGSTIFDISGNEFHGTLTNFTLSNAWGTTQNNYHYNLKNGFTSEYEVYSSDFSSGTDSWVLVLSGGSIDGNIDSINGEDDVARFTLGGGSNWHVSQHTTTSFLISGVNYKVTGKVYIPSGQTINGVAFAYANGTVMTDGDHYNIEGDWYEFENLFTAPADTDFRIIPYTNTSAPVDADGDVYYFKDIKITNTDVRVPALSDNSSSAAGTSISNPSGNWHNDAETELNAPNAPAMHVANDNEGNDFLFDNSDNVIDLSYSSFVDDINNTHYFFSDTSETNQVKNLLIFDSEKSGSDLGEIQNYLNH
ncbi:carbohydrate binding domain-containing protein [Bacteriovoracaceae bacterium]|nr:carbohydrate binding domain-containing protein [Bacteriovoracaceae bacterium]